MILLWFMKWVIQTAFQTKIVCEKESTRASDFSATLKSLSDHFMNLLDLFFENNQLEWTILLLFTKQVIQNALQPILWTELTRMNDYLVVESAFQTDLTKMGVNCVSTYRV